MLTSARIVLKDWNEGGYRGKDADNPAIGMARGEVLIGGPAVCQGYYTSPNTPDPELVGIGIEAESCRLYSPAA